MCEQCQRYAAHIAALEAHNKALEIALQNGQRSLAALGKQARKTKAAVQATRPAAREVVMLTESPCKAFVCATPKETTPCS